MGICATYHFRLANTSQLDAPLSGSGAAWGSSSGVRHAPAPHAGGGMASDAAGPIQQSWRLVKDDLGTLGREIFTRLFARLPETRDMFGFQGDANFLTSRSLRVHVLVLMRTVGKLVAGITDLAAFMPVLMRLGRTHATLGVPIASYDAMRDVMEEVLAERLGATWTPEVRQAWHSAFDAISTAIVAHYPKP